MHRAEGWADGGAQDLARPGGARGPRVRLSRFERSARLWLHAYPRRWRRDRGDEVVGVLLELAGAGGATGGLAGAGPTPASAVLDRGIGPRAALDLVRHGWATRLREHPPLHRWLAYHGFGTRLPVRYRGWAADEIDGALFGLRRAWPQILVCVLLKMWTADAWTGFIAGTAVVVAVMQLPPVDRRRREHERERHVLARPGEPLVRGLYVATAGPRLRRPSSWVAPRVIALDVVAIAAGVATTLLAPQTLVGAPTRDGLSIEPGPPGVVRALVLAAIALAGLLAALVNRRARRALATSLPDLPPQPHRVVQAPGPTHDLWLLANAAAIVGVAFVEIVATRTLVLSPLIALVAAAHLPRALAMAAAARRVGHRAPDDTPLAWADLSALAATRRPPRPDQPVRVVRRWDGPTVPGQVVLGPRASTGEDRERTDPVRLA